MRNRRLKELRLSQERQKNCTFKPQKYSKLDYEYLEEYKDPATRLYNNFSEVQDRLNNAREERDRELRSLSEARPINLSITNNFINSSINIQSDDRSDTNSKRLYVDV